MIRTPLPDWRTSRCCIPSVESLRLRNDDDGQGLNEVGTALAAGRGHVFGVTEGPGHRTVLAFMPDHPENGVGTLAQVRTSEGPPTTPVRQGLRRSQPRPRSGSWSSSGSGDAAAWRRAASAAAAPAYGQYALICWRRLNFR